MDAPVNLQAALDTIDGPWQPLTVAVVNDYDVRVVVKVDGEFTWHSHPETDELFHVLSGASSRIPECFVPRNPGSETLG
jgi:hypothetical protein